MTLIHFALMLLHFVILHFAAIVITFSVSITFCGDYYILRANTRLLKDPVDVITPSLANLQINIVKYFHECELQ